MVTGAPDSRPVQHDWSQTRTTDGALVQDSAFGPLRGALESHPETVSGMGGNMSFDMYTADAEIRNR